MSAEDFEVFKILRRERQEKRRKRLENTDTSGWKRLTEYQYRLVLDHERFIDWYPSSNKWCLHNTKKKKCGGTGALLTEICAKRLKT
jgi:hypothetical protein